MKPTKTRIALAVALNAFLVLIVGWFAARFIGNYIRDNSGEVLTPGLVAILVATMLLVVILGMFGLVGEAALRRTRQRFPDRLVYKALPYVNRDFVGVADAYLLDPVWERKRNIYLTVATHSVAIVSDKVDAKELQICTKDVDFRVERVMGWLTTTAVIRISAPGYRPARLALPVVWTCGLFTMSGRKLRRIIEALDGGVRRP
jgi:hypothetical protein